MSSARGFPAWAVQEGQQAASILRSPTSVGAPPSQSPHNQRAARQPTATASEGGLGRARSLGFDCFCKGPWGHGCGADRLWAIQQGPPLGAAPPRKSRRWPLGRPGILQGETAPERQRKFAAAGGAARRVNRAPLKARQCSKSSMTVMPVCAKPPSSTKAPGAALKEMCREMRSWGRTRLLMTRPNIASYRCACIP